MLVHEQHRSESSSPSGDVEKHDVSILEDVKEDVLVAYEAVDPAADKR